MLVDTNTSICQEENSETNTVVVKDEDEIVGFSSSVAQLREETKQVEEMVQEIKTVKETIEYNIEPDEKVEQVSVVVGKITEKIDRLENIIDDLVQRLSTCSSSGYQSKETETTEIEIAESETQTTSLDLTVSPSLNDSIKKVMTRREELFYIKQRIKEKMDKYTYKASDETSKKSNFSKSSMGTIIICKS